VVRRRYPKLQSEIVVSCDLSWHDGVIADQSARNAWHFLVNVIDDRQRRVQSAEVVPMRVALKI